MRGAVSALLVLALGACDRGGPRAEPPHTPAGHVPAYQGGFRIPLEGRWRVHRTHYGRDDDQATAVDLVRDAPLPKRGSPLDHYPSYRQPIFADAPGRVVLAVDGIPDNPQGVINGYDAHGNYLVIDHGDGTFSLFAHLIPGSLQVRVGQMVGMGQVIGSVGNSGRTSMPHLHWQVMDGPLAHRAKGVPIRLLPFERNGKRSTDRLEKGDRVEAVR